MLASRALVFRLALGLAPALLLACAASTSTGPATSASQARTVRVLFTGNHVIESDDLRALTHVDKTPDLGAPEHAGELARLAAYDHLWVNALYYDRGYVLVQTEPPAVAESADGAFVDVTFRIVSEGERFRLGRVEAHERDENGRTVEPLDGDSLHRLVTVSSGSWFARDALVRDLMAIRRFYRDRGYANVQAEPETDMNRAKSTVDVIIPIRRGPLVHVERIDVSAPTELVAILRAELQLAEGDPFNESKLEESRRRMEGASHGRPVELSTKRGSDDAHVVILFDVRH